jgi:hypothetical protein
MDTNTAVKLNPRSLLVLATLFLSSCVGAVQMISTSTPTPDERDEIQTTSPATLISTSTSTPTPAITIEPDETQVTSPIATARKILRLGTMTSLREAGFSFRPPLGFIERYQYGQVTLTSDDGGTVLSLIGGRSINGEDTESDLFNFAELISDTFQELNIGTPYQFLVEDVEGLATDVDGIWGDSTVSGRIVVISPDEEQIFYALAISSSNTSRGGWEPEGRQVFEAVLGSVTFFPPAESEE